MKKLLLFSVLVILCPFALAGCGSGGSDRTVATGDTVSVHYTGTLQDGAVFDSSIGKTPLTFTVGSGQVITGFDNAVIGMKVGEKKTVTLPPEEAYGQYNPNLIIILDRSKFQDNIAIGMQVTLTDTSGQQILATITEIGPSSVTLDANSKLAGKTLIFEIEIVSIS